MIGTNVPQATEPFEILPAPDSNKGPYATKTRLGWFISGLGIYNGFNYNVHSVNVEDIDTRHILLDKYKRDFHDLNSTEI